MSKSKQKELQRLKAQKQHRQQLFAQALDRLLNQQQTMRITLDYSRQYLEGTFQESLLEYSPTHISRMVFSKQLDAIKEEMLLMPNGEARMEHFILIVLKVMDFPFERVPLFMVGLKDMFRQIAQQGKQVITFPEIFKYMVGELVVMDEQDKKGTEFHIQFNEKKKQDYLLHDNGIKKVLFSTDLHLFLSLDRRQNLIKIYDQNMRNINRFAAKKEMHGGKIPQIIDFDYSQMTMRLAVLFADSTLESIHLPNFVNKNQTDFEMYSLNQLIQPLPKKMSRVYYLQMISKWLTLSDEPDELFLFDMQKVRLKPQQVEQMIKINTNQMPVSQALEVIPLSVVCIVAGNELSFYDQKLSEQKIVKFCHHEIIKVLRFCQQNNTFYISGEFQKAITIFTVSRSKKSFKISTKTINKAIVDFLVFPYFQTILICDQAHDLRLMHEPSWTTYKQQSYQSIVKVEGQQLQCYKTGKTDFIVFQTYMIALEQEKVAIEKEVEFNFLPQHYYDPRKEELFLSLNDQIISLSLPFGQIRRNFNSDNSNAQKHSCFFMGKAGVPFLIDHTQNLYEVYMKSELSDGQNKLYRKKIVLPEPVAYCYDEQMRNMMVINHNTVTQIRNDLNNHFNSVNSIRLLDFPRITNAKFCKATKYLTLLTQDLLLYQIKNFDTHMSKCFKVVFEKNPSHVVQGTLIDFHYCHELEIFLVLSSNKELGIFQRLNPSNHVIIHIEDCLPFKLKGLNFFRFIFYTFREKGIQIPSVLLLDDSGYLLDIQLKKVISKKFFDTKKEQKESKSFQKEPYDINNTIRVDTVLLQQSNHIKIGQSEFKLQKAHDRKIAVACKLKLQIPVVVTVGLDGLVKLWRSDFQSLFALKLPNLIRYSWNMTEIHEIKNKKSVKEINQIIQKYFVSNKSIASPKASEMVEKNKIFKQSRQLPKKFKFQEDLPLQIDSKEVEDIILKQEDYLRQYLTSRRVINLKTPFNPEMSTMDVHPWRTRRQFLRIYQRASPTNKYASSMPRNLVSMRNSLDMKERKKKKENHETAEKLLPMLKTYQKETPQRDQAKKGQKGKNKDEDETFQSCVYVKSERQRKKPNQMDEIDRQFRRKLIDMRNRRVTNYFKQDRKGQTIDIAESSIIPFEGTSQDAIRGIQSVFQQHNKEAFQSKRGRIIKVPKIKVLRGYQDTQQ